MKKITKLCTALVLALLLLIPFMGVTASAEENSGEPVIAAAIVSGGGTAENPYILEDTADLNAMRMFPDAHFRLAADLIFDAADDPWVPIPYFGGSLDGAGHRIEGLKIVGSSNSVGLFGTLSGAVTRLGMVDCDVSAKFSAEYNYIGGFAGVVDTGGSVSECWFAGTIKASGYKNGRVGGIAGKVNSGAKVLDCYNLGTLDGMGMTYCWLGGVVAHNLGEVSRCYNAGFLSSKNPRGVVGYDEYSTITANYYLANGALSSSKAVELTHTQMKNSGNFVGFDFDNVWIMRNENHYCYPELRAVPLHLNMNSMEITAMPESVIYVKDMDMAMVIGGSAKVTYTNGFEIATDMRAAEISGVTAEAGTQSVTFTLGGTSVTANVPVYAVDSGCGTEKDPFCISTKEQLQSLEAATYSTYFKLTEDLTFTDEDFSEGGAFYNGGKLWEPIGVDYMDPFCGNFDGGKHTITGLRINNNFGSNGDKPAYLGLFGYVSGAVSDLRLRNINFLGTGRYGYVGGIAGGTSGTISGCYVESGRIVANVGSGFFRSSAVAGGIVGISTRGYIYGCRNAAYIEANPLSNYDSAHAAGIAGMMDGGSITQSYNLGNATAILRMGGANAVYAGGISAAVSSGSISNCYNTGVSCGSYGNGGIAGLSYGTVSNCYNTAAINRGTYGAIVGVQYGTVSGCYYLDNTTRGIGSGSGTTTQLTDSKMQKQTYFATFDFTNAWTMDGTEGYDYPELRGNTMLPVLSIKTQPKDIAAAKGESVSVKVKATGSGLTYRWYTKKAGDAEFTETSADSATYKCKMSSEVNGMQLYCVITDEYGSSVKTQTVALSMVVSIKTQPKTQYVQLGEKAKFTVKAEGEGLKYQWYYKSAGSSKYKKASCTKSSYTITMTEDRKDRRFYCVIKDKYGNEVKSKTVYMRLAATVTTEPKTTYTELGEKAKFKVKAVGDGLTYQWYYKSAGSSKYKKASSTKSSYSLEMTEDRRDRKFYCVITDEYGNSVKTKTVTMRMAASVKTQPKDAKAAYGKKVKTTVKAVGDGLTYTWYYKDPGKSKYKKSSCESATYTAEMKSSRNGRKVYCIIEDKYGNTAKTKTVTLKKK